MRPNILYILNDHQAYYGHEKARRPVFDKLASEGISFERAYSVCPLCGPARRSMLTSMYPHNHGEIHNDVNHPYDKALYLDILDKAGYDQYYYGKWHAGAGTALEHGCKGFNYPSYNNPYTKPEYKEYLKELNLPEPEIFVEHNFFGHMNCEGRVFRQDKGWCNEHACGIMLGPTQTQESFFLAHLAVKQLKELAKQSGNKPFSMRVDFWGPHQPYFPSKEYADMYSENDVTLPISFYENVHTNNKPEVLSRENNKGLNYYGKIIYPNPLETGIWKRIMARAYAQITMVDAAAGIILDALKELGLDKNTMVIMSTDHGDALACHGGHFDKASYTVEEVLRIPMAIRYPDKIKAGQKSKEFVSNLDIGATILDAAGERFPEPVDGISMLGIATNPKSKGREYIVSESNGHCEKHLGRAIMKDNYKFVFNRAQLNELYDLDNDPFELNNLAVKEQYKDKCAQMLSLLKEWAITTNDSEFLKEIE